MELKTLTSYLDNYFNIGSITDYSWNGLQVEASDEVANIVFAVDSGRAVIGNCPDSSLLIVHHGLFWKGADPSLRGVMGDKIAELYRRSISLYAVHLPLDMDLKIGNNVSLIELIGATYCGGFSAHGGGYIGAWGEFSQPVEIAYIVDNLTSSLGGVKTLIDSGRGAVKRVAALSGAASRGDLQEAISLGVDLFITGEERDWYHDAKDFGISVLFLGHHSSERGGIKALSKQMGDLYPHLNNIVLNYPTGL